MHHLISQFVISSCGIPYLIVELRVKKRCPAEWERGPGTFGNHTKGGYEKNFFATNYVAQSVPTLKNALK